VSLSPEKALKHRLVMLSGDEEALRRRGLTELLSAAGVAADDFDLERMDGDSPPGQWAASAGTSPFLAERRVVIVRHLLRADIEKGKASGFENLPGTSLLILVADEESGDESKQGRLTTARKGWERLVSAAGGLVVAFDSNPKDLRESIKNEVARLDKTISDRAAETLGEMVGGSVSRSIEELEKLAVYVGDERAIREGDVKTVVMPSREWSVFRLVDSVVDGDVAEALRQLRDMVGSSEKAEDVAFRSILPMLGRHLRLIWQARVCLDAKANPDSPPDSVLACFPAKPHLASERPFVRSKAVRAARALNLGQLTRCLELLSDTDAKLKGALPSFSGIETLEQLVLALVETVRGPVAAR
jgi:DNA polymerase-3 subunit delta